MTTPSTTTVGIIGAGNIAQAFARLVARAGAEAVISHRGGPDDIRALAATLGPGVRADTVAVAATAPTVVLAVPWAAVPDAVSGVDLDGRIVIDTSNAMTVTFAGEVPTFTPVDLGGRTSSEVVADLVPGGRVVKAANTLTAAVLAADPSQGGGRRVLFLSGDDTAAKADVAALFTAAGFSPVDLGGLAEGGRMQQLVTGPLAGLNLVRLN